jgi:excisionase family DNA binding protein
MTEAIFLTPKEAADILSVKVSTIYKWVHFKQIPYRKHGKLLRFDRRSLIIWSNAREIQPYSNIS